MKDIYLFMDIPNTTLSKIFIELGNEIYFLVDREDMGCPQVRPGKG